MRASWVSGCLWLLVSAVLSDRCRAQDAFPPVPELPVSVADGSVLLPWDTHDRDAFARKGIHTLYLISLDSAGADPKQGYMTFYGRYTVQGDVLPTNRPRTWGIENEGSKIAYDKRGRMLTSETQWANIVGCGTGGAARVHGHQRTVYSWDGSQLAAADRFGVGRSATGGEKLVQSGGVRYYYNRRRQLDRAYDYYITGDSIPDSFGTVTYYRYDAAGRMMMSLSKDYVHPHSFPGVDSVWSLVDDDFGEATIRESWAWQDTVRKYEYGKSLDNSDEDDEEDEAAEERAEELQELRDSLDDGIITRGGGDRFWQKGVVQQWDAQGRLMARTSLRWDEVESIDSLTYDLEGKLLLRRSWKFSQYAPGASIETWRYQWRDNRVAIVHYTEGSVEKETRSFQPERRKEYQFTYEKSGRLATAVTKETLLGATATEAEHWSRAVHSGRFLTAQYGGTVPD